MKSSGFVVWSGKSTEIAIAAMSAS